MGSDIIFVQHHHSNDFTLVRIDPHFHIILAITAHGQIPAHQLDQTLLLSMFAPLLLGLNLLLLHHQSIKWVTLLFSVYTYFEYERLCRESLYAHFLIFPSAYQFAYGVSENAVHIELSYQNDGLRLYKDAAQFQLTDYICDASGASSVAVSK